MSHHPCIWTVEHHSLPADLAVAPETMAGARTIGTVGTVSRDAIDCADGAQPVQLQLDEGTEVAVLEVGPLLVVGAVTLRSTLGHHHEALLCVRDGRYWAVLFGSAFRWTAYEVSGDNLEHLWPEGRPSVASMSAARASADAHEEVRRNMPAAPPVTDDAIRARMAIAREAGELDLVDLCQMALDGHLAMRSYLQGILRAEAGDAPGAQLAAQLGLVAGDADPAAPTVAAFDAVLADVADPDPAA